MFFKQPSKLDVMIMPSAVVAMSAEMIHSENGCVEVTKILLSTGKSILVNHPFRVTVEIFKEALK